MTLSWNPQIITGLGLLFVGAWRPRRRESRERRVAQVNARATSIFTEHRAQHELIGQLLDKGHDLRADGDDEKAKVCFEAAGELVRAGS